MKLTSFWMRLTHGFSGSLYWSVCAQAMLKPALKRAQWSLATERKTKHNSHNNYNKQQPNIPKPNRSLPIVCQKRNSIINIIITNRQEWPLDFQWFSPTKSKKAQGASDPSCSCRGCIRRAPPRRRPPLRRRRPHSPLPQAPSWPQVAMDPMAKCQWPKCMHEGPTFKQLKILKGPKRVEVPNKKWIKPFFKVRPTSAHLRKSSCETNVRAKQILDTPPTKRGVFKVTSECERRIVSSENKSM